MAASREFRVLVASDGSLPATAAVVTASSWPWPKPTRLSGIVVENVPVDGRAQLRAAEAQAAEAVRASVEKALKRRWPEARVSRYAGDATATIVTQARRTRANLIVMGWRGHGSMRRLLVGSVSRGVVRQAACSVLVVRRASRELRRVVIGYDGSANSRRAIQFLSRLFPGAGTVTVVMAVQLVSVPSRTMISAAATGTIQEARARENRGRLRQARRVVDAAAKPLRDAGWKVEYVVAEKPPLDALLAACAAKNADVLAVGATGATGLRGLIVGSVAQGALDRSRTPVLIVR